MKRRVAPILALVAFLVPIGLSQAIAQPTNVGPGVRTANSLGTGISARPAPTGERLFLQCRACHSLTTDQGGKVGPALGGLFTRGAGRVAGFDYSVGMRAYGGTWSDDRLSAFLLAPSRTIAGTKMAFVGIPDAARRDALIAYLRANTATAPTTKK